MTRSSIFNRTMIALPVQAIFPFAVLADIAQPKTVGQDLGSSWSVVVGSALVAIAAVAVIVWIGIKISTRSLK